MSSGTRLSATLAQSGDVVGTVERGIVPPIGNLLWSSALRGRGTDEEGIVDEDHSASIDLVVVIARPGDTQGRRRFARGATAGDLFSSGPQRDKF